MNEETKAYIDQQIEDLRAELYENITDREIAQIEIDQAETAGEIAQFGPD